MQSVPWSDVSTPHFFSCFVNQRHCVLFLQKENHHSDYYQRKVQKLDSDGIRVCQSAHDMGNLHICDDAINVASFGTMYYCISKFFPVLSSSLSRTSGKNSTFKTSKIIVLSY